MTFGYSHGVTRALLVEASHLVDEEPQGGALEHEVLDREPHVVKRVPIGFPVMREGELCNREHQDKRGLRPHISFHQTRRQRLDGCPWAEVAARNDQGCSLKQEGAQRAASKRLPNISSSTSRFEKARGLQREPMSSWTGYEVVARFCTSVPQMLFGAP